MRNLPCCKARSIHIFYTILSTLSTGRPSPMTKMKSVKWSPLCRIMFRLSRTKSHSSYIRVAQEMEYVRSYLVLQQFRYEDCLSVSITIPDTVAELYIPRFTLQPLVENAIKHGMISPDDPFTIDLEIFIREHTLHIRIGNDGTRISLEQMKKLLDSDASRQELLDFDQKSYGVAYIPPIQILCGVSSWSFLRDTKQPYLV